MIEAMGCGFWADGDSSHDQDGSGSHRQPDDGMEAPRPDRASDGPATGNPVDARRDQQTLASSGEALADNAGAGDRVAWMFGDGMIAALDKAIDAASDDDAALSREQVQEAQNMADMLAIERKECALIFEAERQGSIIHFRNDCSPQGGMSIFDLDLFDAGGRASPRLSRKGAVSMSIDITWECAASVPVPDRWSLCWPSGCAVVGPSWRSPRSRAMPG
jgi:hypothetical protein